MKVLLILLLLVSFGFAQAPIFGSVSAPEDTVTADSISTVSSILLKFNAYPEGVATLYMAGDSISGTPLGVLGEYQIWYGINMTGDSLWGVWTAFSDSVLLIGDLDNGAYDSGTMTGRGTDLGAVWFLGLGVRFRFTANTAAANETLLLGRLLFY